MPAKGFLWLTICKSCNQACCFGQENSWICLLDQNIICSFETQRFHGKCKFHTLWGAVFKDGWFWRYFIKFFFLILTLPWIVNEKMLIYIQSLLSLIGLVQIWISYGAMNERSTVIFQLYFSFIQNTFLIKYEVIFILIASYGFTIFYHFMWKIVRNSLPASGAPSCILWFQILKWL